MANNYHQSFTVFNALGDGVKIMKNEISFFGFLVVIYAVLASLPYMLLMNDISDPQELMVLLEDGNFPFIIFHAFYYLLYGIVIIITLDKVHATYNNIDFQNYPYVSRAIKAVLPVIGVYILSIILTFLGFLLIIIPGFIIMMKLYLSIPAKLAENIGIIAALKRSSELTNGNKWGIFGTLVTPIIPIMIISFLIFSSMIGDVQNNGATLPEIDPVFTVIYTIFSSFAAVYFIVLMGVMYQQIVAERKTIEDESF